MPLVSIPFIAGQWSLPPCGARAWGRCRKFQSPSLRGSGRFLTRVFSSTCFTACFNPLHCGAVVASATRKENKHMNLNVSIPFIAGQWSLRGPRDAPPAYAQVGFNPLHCGAVVASPGSPPNPKNQKSFNPLHCGAVVASRPPTPKTKKGRKFQSPSLRGSGRFRAWRAEAAREVEFQSPSLRGSGRFRGDELRGARRARPCFNPLHCGAVVASVRLSHAAREVLVFQSPSLRGSGRFACCSRRRSGSFSGFNPLHCGAVVASCHP